MTRRPRIDASITLPDGRRLAYAEYGDPGGSAVLLFHGLPGSRLSWGRLPSEPPPPGLRLVAPDRPGYGGSDPNPGRTLLDWADDVRALADALDLPHFSVVGVSGGGPGALACAWKLPDRVTSARVVSSPAPPDAPGVFEKMSRINRFFMALARRVPALSTLNVRFLAAVIRRNPGRYIDTLQRKLHEVDRALLARPEVRQMLIDDFREALGAGPQGMVDDMAANHGRPWGFALDAIETEVRIWSCDLDRSVPPAMGRYLNETLPTSRITYVPNAGHLWVLVHLGEVLETLLPAIQHTDDPRP
jgi:pimeloyl-ACP methyl ester carboxylesterase